MIRIDEWQKSSYSNPGGNCVETIWRKSSHSTADGQCVECATWRKGRSSMKEHCIEAGSWRKTAFSHTDRHCVECGHGDSTIGVRDTKQKNIGYPDVLEFTPRQWRTFITEIKGGNTWG